MLDRVRKALGTPARVRQAAPVAQRA